MEVSSLPRAAGTVRLPPRLLAPLSDHRLVEQIRRGNEPAFEVVYDRHHPGLLSFCRHMLGSREEAEDAVQQTFASAYGDLLRDDKPIRLKPWLYTIARNRCLSFLRARHEEAAELADIPTAGLSDAVLEREEVRRLLGDVRRLPEDQRAALVLSEIGDLSHAEVAQVVGCEATQVKSLVFQARSSLIASREAAEIPCHEIREEIATARGAALRRDVLRRHMRACPACSAFRDDVRRQRQLLALALPVVPTAALKNSVLAAAGLGHAAGGGAAAGAGVAGSTVAAGGTATGGGAGIAAGVGGTGGGGLIASLGAIGGAKLAVVAVVAAGVAGGGIAVDEFAISQNGGGNSGAGGAFAGGGGSGASGGSAVSRAVGSGFGTKLGSGWAAGAGGAAGSANGNGPPAWANGGSKGNGNGGGKGGGNGNGGNGPQAFQKQTGGGVTTAPGQNGGGSSTNSNAGGNGNGNAYGNGSGNGNAHGNGGGGGNSQGPTGQSPSHTPNGNAYGVYGHPQPSAPAPPPSDGGQNANPGKHLGNGKGGSGG